MMAAMDQAFAVLPVFLALVLAAAAVHKLVQRERLALAATALAGVSPALGRIFSLVAALVEAAAAIAMIAPASRPVAGAVAAGLLTLYALLIANRGRKGAGPFDCGCDFGQARAMAGAGFRLLRPLALAALAILVAVGPAPGVALEPFVAAFGFFALYLAVGEIMALPPVRRRAVA